MATAVQTKNVSGGKKKASIKTLTVIVAYKLGG